MRAVIRLDLVDASLNGASADRHFATAYNAALKAAKIACAGYRLVGAGHTGFPSTWLSSQWGKLRTCTVITSTGAGGGGT